MASNTIGSLLVRIGADTSELLRGTKKSKTAMQQLGAAGKKAGLALAAGVTAATAALTVLTKASFANIDVLAKQADALDIDTKALAGLQHGAELAGIASADLDKALLRQRKTIFDAAKGLSTATDALDALGLRTEDLLKLNTEEQFHAIADALNGVESATMRAGVAQDIFGRKGQQLLNFTQEGSEGLRALTEEAGRLGIGISRIDAAKVEQANDAMLRVRQRAAGVGNVIAVQLAPIVSGLADTFVDAGDGADALQKRVQAAVDKMVQSVGFVSDALFGWKLVFAGIETAVINMVATAAEALDKLSVDTDKVGRNLIRILSPAVSLPEELDKSSDASASLVANLAASAEAAEANFAALAASEKPSERLAASVARFRAEAQQAAEATASASKTFIDAAGEGDSGPTAEQQAADKAAAEAKERAAKALEDARKLAEQRKQDLHQRFADERVLAKEFFEQQQADLLEALEVRAVTEEEFRAARLDLERQHQERLTEIEREGLTAREAFERMSLSNKVQMVSGQLAQITSTVANNNKALFKANKAAALAEAAVSLPSAVLKAIENAGGLPFGAFAGAATAAAGAARIAEIKNAQFGGGTTPGAAGTVSTVGGQIAPQSSERVVSVQGVDPDKFFSGRQVVDLLNEATKDGAKLVFTEG